MTWIGQRPSIPPLSLGMVWWTSVFSLPAAPSPHEAATSCMVIQDPRMRPRSALKQPKESGQNAGACNYLRAAPAPLADPLERLRLACANVVDAAVLHA